MAGGRAEKTLAKMRVNPKGWRYAEVARVLEACGFELKSRRGSHCVFKHPSGVRTLVVDHGSGAVLPVYVTNAIAAIDQLPEDI